MCYSILFFADPTRTHFVRKAHDWVRICRSEIGERLAQRGIFQAESVQILAKGEIPVPATIFEESKAFLFLFRKSTYGSCQRRDFRKALAGES